MNPLLVADCVSKSFRGRSVLSASSLRAVPGELRVLLGRNGVGKTTLIKIAAGLLQPDSGFVRYGDQRYLSVRLRQLAERGLFYLPDRNLLSSAFSVRRNLEMIRRQFSGAAIEECAARVGVVERLDQHLWQLSGGELRRVELAAILVRRPRCVLADEPYRGIDPKDAEYLTRTFRGLATDGVAVVVSGHEVPTLLGAADHVTWCTSGTTYELGPPDVASHHDAFRRDYLGTLGNS
jgi:lipopolysaccharide export system ATP-binding protein